MNVKNPPARIREAEQIMRAITSGDVDAFVIRKGRGAKIYTLRDEKLLRRVQGELERRVRERTAKLSALNRKLTQEIERRKQTETKLHAIMRERERLQRDLHDNIIQSIYGIGLSIEECGELLKERRTKEASRCMTMAITALDGVMEAVRTHLSDRRPVLSAGQFVASLQGLARPASRRARFSMNVDPDAADLLEDGAAAELLAIAQEAISNSIRHAEAESRTLTFGRQNGRAVLEIKDNGMGFNPRTAPDGHGLRNMEARAKHAGWDFRVASARGAGTIVTVEIPGAGGRHGVR